MSSRNFDLEYDDYKERRNAAGMGSRASSRNGRFKPVDKEKEKKEKEIGDYELPKNEYQMQGYAEKNSDVGSDPLASVRTLRNNLRVMSLEHRDKDEPVKAHLCQSACDDLSKAEKQLIELSHQRSDAVVRGDSKQVETIAKDMERVKSDAIRNAYSDLMMDDGAMKAFGVNSKWTPDKNPMPPNDWKPMTPMKPRKRAETPNGRRKTESRQSVRGNNDNGDRKIASRASTRSAERRVIPEETKFKTKPIRKNQRLSTIGHAPEAIPIENPMAGGSTVQDDPYKMPTYVGRCPHCQLTEAGLGSSGAMERHYARYCKVMTSCKYCMKLTMVSQLTDHLIYRCEFLQDTMEACKDCGLAIEKEDQRRGGSHPMCRGRRPPSGAQWCPLCTIAVEDSEDSWREHLLNNCYNNPRRDGPEKDPWEMKQEQDNILRVAKEKKRLEEEEEKRQKEAEARKQQQQVVVNNSGYPGRMIDADKLVVALQEIQDRKKAEKKKKLKEIEKENAS